MAATLRRIPFANDVALDWLISKAMAHDDDYQRHYFHICDEIADSCGCKYQGDGVPSVPGEEAP